MTASGAWEFREMDEPDKTERATLVDDDERAACNAVATRRFRLYLSVYLLTSLMRLTI